MERLSIRLRPVTVSSEERTRQISRTVCNRTLMNGIIERNRRFCMPHHLKIIPFHCSPRKMTVRNSVIPCIHAATLIIRVVEQYHGVILRNNQSVISHLRYNLRELRIRSQTTAKTKNVNNLFGRYATVRSFAKTKSVINFFILRIFCD